MDYIANISCQKHHRQGSQDHGTILRDNRAKKTEYTDR